MFVFQLSSVQMVRSSWDCPCRRGGRSMYESDNTSGAGFDPIGQKREEV